MTLVLILWRQIHVFHLLGWFLLQNRFINKKHKNRLQELEFGMVQHGKHQLSDKLLKVVDDNDNYTVPFYCTNLIPTNPILPWDNRA